MRLQRNGVVVFALGAVAFSGSVQALDLEMVYLGGHTVVPGEVETFNSPAVSWASINDAGQVSSLAGWTPEGQQFGNLGMFKWDSGVLTDLLKDTDVVNAPGFGVPTTNVQLGMISDTGNIAFKYHASGESAIATGPSRAGLNMIVRSGGANAPGTASPFQFVDVPSHNDSRIVVYGNANNDIGFWAGNENGLTSLIAQENQTLVPGTPSLIDDLVFIEPALNSSGFVAFSAGYSSVNRAVIAGNTSANLFTLAKTGDPIPGDAFGGFEDYFGSVTVNNAGNVAFSATVNLSGQSEDGIFRTYNSVLDDVAIETVTTVPGEGLTEFDDVSFPVLAGDDKLYFRGQWDGYSERGLFVQEYGVGISTLFKTGDNAPGTNATFTGFGAFHANANGDYIFTAYLDNGKKALFAALNGGSQVVPVLMEGQNLDATGLGEYAVLTDIELPYSGGGEDGLGVWFNENGQLLVELVFDPSRDLPHVTSGLYVINLPEPTSMVLLGLGGVALLRRSK